MEVVLFEEFQMVQPSPLHPLLELPYNFGEYFRILIAGKSTERLNPCTLRFI